MARSEVPAAGGATQPDGSPSKYPKMRESLRLLGSGQPTVSGTKTTRDFAFNSVNKAVGAAAFGLDIRDLPDSEEIWDRVESLEKRLKGFIAKPETATDDAIQKYHKAAKSAGKAIAKAAIRGDFS